MILSLALLGGALLAGWFTPVLLGKVNPVRWDPRTLLAAWLVSVAGTVLAFALGIVLLLPADHGGAFLFTAVQACWTALAHGAVPSAEQVAGVLGALLLVAVALRLVIIAVREVRDRIETREECLSTLRMIARCDGDSPMTFWLADDEPMAFSLARRPTGIVVATAGLARRLSETEIAAVLEHEYAHLRGKHHVLILCLDILGRALPIVPLFRHARDAAGQLVELTADVAAARAFGRDAIRSAIAVVAGHDAPQGALAHADDAIEVRLARLDRGPAPAGPIRRALSCAAAAAAAVSAPVGVSAGMLAVACPLGLL